MPNVQHSIIYENLKIKGPLSALNPLSEISLMQCNLVV